MQLQPVVRVVLLGALQSSKIPKIQKKLEVGLIRIKKLENRPKTKFCVCTIRPCLAVHSECDSAPEAKKQNVYKTCNVCLKAFPSAHYLTKHKQEAGHKKK